MASWYDNMEFIDTEIELVAIPLQQNVTVQEVINKQLKEVHLRFNFKGEKIYIVLNRLGNVVSVLTEK